MLRLFATLLLVSFPGVADAQWPAGGDLSGAYSVLHVSRDAVNLREGWAAGLAVPVIGALSAAADVGWNRRVVSAAGTDLHLRVIDLMAGVRLSARLGRATEFAQLLTGVVVGTGSGFGVTTTETDLGVQPGVGLDYPIGAGLSGRLQVDARFIRPRAGATAPGSQFRTVVGVSYRFH